MSETLQENLARIIRGIPGDTGVKARFKVRLAKGQLTRDENPLTHFCVYFPAFDPAAGRVFIGHHIKSDQWLFNGGHIDRGEADPWQTVVREVGEEWGAKVQLSREYPPSLLTITEIDNPRQTCRRHFDIWYFLPFEQAGFRPDPGLIRKEFHQAGWRTITQARDLITDANNLRALEMIENRVAG